MSIKTRINRPTYATPRKVGNPRFVWVSTDYRWIEVDGSPRFLRVSKCRTYKRPD